MGVLLALLSSLCFAAFGFVLKKSLNKTKNPEAVGVVYQVIGGLVGFLFIINDGMRFDNISILSLVLFVISTVLYGYATLLVVKTGKVLDVSFTGILAQSTLIFTFFGGILLFKESLTIGKIFGVLFIIIGNIIVVTGYKHNKQNNKMIALRVLACFIMGVANLIDGYNGKFFPLSFYIIVSYIIGGVIAYYGGKMNIAMIKEEIKSNCLGQITLGICASVGYFLFLQAFNYAEKSIVFPLAYTNTIMVVVLGIIFLKEWDSIKKKIFAVILAFIGSVLINL